MEKVAINAVMAGARPEYMPVLLALTEAMAKDPGAMIATMGGSGLFSNPVVVCGPVANEIGLIREAVRDPRLFCPVYPPIW